MPHRELPAREQLLHRRRQPQQPQKVRHSRALLAHSSGDLLLRHPELVVQLVIRVRLFHRVEVFALDVLDQRELQRVAGLEGVLHHGRHGGQPRLLRGAEAALAGDQLVLIAGAHDHERLHDAMLADAARELVDRCLVEHAARLIRIGLDLIDRNLRHSRRVRVRRRLRSLRNQRAETAAEDFLVIHSWQLTVGSWPLALGQRPTAIGQRHIVSARRMNSFASDTYASLPRERMSYRIIGFPNDGASPSRTLRGMTVW